MGEGDVLVRVVVDRDNVYAVCEARPACESLQQEVHLRRSRESDNSQEIELAARAPSAADQRARA